MPSKIEFTPSKLLGDLQQEPSALLDGGTTFTVTREGDGLLYSFAPGLLANFQWLTADFLLEGRYLTVFQLRLREGQTGPCFEWNFGLLNQCQARLRMPLEAVNQNRWMYPREGAYLKPMCGGQRVDLSRVDLLELVVLRKSDEPSRFSITPFTATVGEPEKLENPILPAGALLNQWGQSTLHNWAEKTSGDEELRVRLQTQRAMAAEQNWPAHFSQWGGDTGQQFEATGWFRTEHDGSRWWLIDPDGHPFWSAGMDCVSPNIDTPLAGLGSALSGLPSLESASSQGTSRRPGFYNYLAANFHRVFGAEEWRAAWGETTLAYLRAWGFNTVANWSDWKLAKDAGFPYVRPLDGHFPTTPLIYRDFPDVFDANFEKDAAAFALQLSDTKDDPAFIGYFLMNEPTWGFAQETPAQGMLFNTTGGAARETLAVWLQEKYASDEALRAAWGDVNFAEVARGTWTKSLTDAARADLSEFSGLMVTRFFVTLSDACRTIDPYHLNLGVRYYTAPPAWCLAGMRTFDVFSMNCYNEQIPADKVTQIAELLQMPVLIGEWHFGALDVGLPATGIGHVRTQIDRGRAFRFYTETAAAHPACVGVHYFTLYDQCATGRFDGENYNIGFLDVCNRPYEPLTAAARAAHENIYDVAGEQKEPFLDAPEYLQKLFL